MNTTNWIPTTGTREQIEAAAFGFLEDSNGHPLAEVIEVDGAVYLNVGPLTNSDARGALESIEQYVELSVFAKWDAELPKWG